MLITFQGPGEISRPSSLGGDSPLDMALECCRGRDSLTMVAYAKFCLKRPEVSLHLTVSIKTPEVEAAAFWLCSVKAGISFQALSLLLFPSLHFPLHLRSRLLSFIVFSPQHQRWDSVKEQDQPQWFRILNLNNRREQGEMTRGHMFVCPLTLSSLELLQSLPFPSAFCHYPHTHFLTTAKGKPKTLDGGQGCW